MGAQFHYIKVYFQNIEWTLNSIALTKKKAWNLMKNTTVKYSIVVYCLFGQLLISFLITFDWLPQPPFIWNLCQRAQSQWASCWISCSNIFCDIPHPLVETVVVAWQRTLVRNDLSASLWTIKCCYKILLVQVSSFYTTSKPRENCKSILFTTATKLVCQM